MDIKLFPRRLQRALPFCFKWWANKRFLPPKEQFQFKQDMKASPADIMEDEFDEDFMKDFMKAADNFPAL